MYSLPLRLLVALGIVLGTLSLLGALLFVTESVFSVWDRLRAAPVWFFYAYTGVMIALSTAAGALVWRVLMPGAKPAGKTAPRVQPALTEAVVRERLDSAEQSGVDVRQAQRELQILSARREAGAIYVSVFGEISSGKTSLIKALLPGEHGEVSVQGGTTRQLAHYVWQSTAGDRLVLVDSPGLNEVGASLDNLARDEALRSHVVIYVCDGDLTRSQLVELQTILALEKPTILALNKIDRYTAEEIAAIRDRLAERLNMARVEIVPISAGGTQEVIRVLPDGREEAVTRQLVPRVAALQMALERHIAGDLSLLEKLRDSSVFTLVARQIDEAVRVYRRRQADDIVKKYGRRAVVGAMAAVSPGTDLLVQGYLGVNMLKELCALYEVPARSLDARAVLDLAQQQVSRTFTLLLAVAGNGFKAFPGIGTVAGGLMHAVAYGLIFDALGSSVSETLETRGALYPAQAVVTFKEKLGEDLGASARRFAEVVLAERKKRAS